MQIVNKFVANVRGLLCAVALAGLFTAVSGCDSPKPTPAANKGGDSKGHSHDDLAIGNFAESVGTLRKFHDQIKTAFEAKKPDDAHDALHEIGHVLEALEKQVASVAADKQEAAKAAVKALFDAYGKIDDAMHHGEEVKYGDMSADLTKNLEALEASK